MKSVPPKILLLALIVFSLTTVYSTSRISTPDFQAIDFAKAKEMRKLKRYKAS